MDELERELRATLGDLAEGPEPSDDLVERTVDRSTQITRHRRIITVASIAASTVALLAVVSIAGAATRDGHVDVAGPSTVDETTTVVTTTVPIVFPTSTTNPPPHNTTVPVVSPTTIAKCEPGPVIDDQPEYLSYTLLDNGNIEVAFPFTFGPARESHFYILDDGTDISDIGNKVYTPTEFGTHWYDTWSQDGGTPENTASCKQRHNFVVDPSVISPTTTSTTVPGETTVPVETTIPESTTTIGG